AEPVAGEKQPAPRGIIDRKGEHAVEAERQFRAPFLITMHQNLGVGVIALEPMAARHQLGTQFSVVIDLAVEDDRNLAVLVEERLAAAGNVDDRKTTMAEEHGL